MGSEKGPPPVSRAGAAGVTEELHLEHPGVKKPNFRSKKQHLERRSLPDLQPWSSSTLEGDGKGKDGDMDVTSSPPLNGARGCWWQG